MYFTDINELHTFVEMVSRDNPGKLTCVTSHTLNTKQHYLSIMQVISKGKTIDRKKRNTEMMFAESSKNLNRSVSI